VAYLVIGTFGYHQIWLWWSRGPRKVHNMQQESKATSQAECSRRWRAGVAAKLDQIRAKLARLAAVVEAERRGALQRPVERERQEHA
jgi:hypothetical protein